MSVPAHARGDARGAPHPSSIHIAAQLLPENAHHDDGCCCCCACARAHLQIARRRKAHQDNKPDAQIISLGIGDTTEPLPPSIANAMAEAAKALGTREGYSGCVHASRVTQGVTSQGWQGLTASQSATQVVRLVTRLVAGIASQKKGPVVPEIAWLRL